MRDKYSEFVAQDMAMQEDAKIRAVLTSAGVDPMGAVRSGRMSRFVYPDGIETIALDGIVILKLHPVEITTSGTPDGIKIMATRKVEARK